MSLSSESECHTEGYNMCIMSEFRFDLVMTEKECDFFLDSNYSQTAPLPPPQLSGPPMWRL